MNSIIPITIISLTLIGLVVFIKNKIKNYQSTTSGNQPISNTELEWRKSLKHSIVMYIAPTIVLVLPFISGHKPAIIDAFQAAVLYLAINYLRNIYYYSN